MREILEQHAARLTPKERRAIWEEVSGARVARSRAESRWALRVAAAMAVVALVAFAIATLQRRPGGSVSHGVAGRPETRAQVEGHAGGPKPLAADHDEHGRAHVGETGVAQPPAGTMPQAHHPAVSAARAHGAVAVTPPAASGAPVVTIPDVIAIPSRPGSTAPVATGPVGSLTGHVLDAQHRPVPFANVVLQGTRTGAMTDENGEYRIDRVPPATYTVQVQAIGHERETLQGVRVGGGETAKADVQMNAPQVVKTVEEVQVSAEKRLVDPKLSATTRQSISAERLREIPVDNLSQAVGTKAGIVAPGGELHFGGGRPGDAKYQFNGVSGIQAAPPVVPTTGGSRLPNDEAFDSMFFKTYGVNPFIAANEDALSTFAVDVDAASYTVTRRYLELGQLPPAAAVRVEEFVNFFAQDYPRFENDDFRIVVDGSPSPFGPGYQLIRIGIKGREIAARDRKPARLTFVIDVSGSMDRENRLELVKRALRLLVDQLRGDDRIGIVIFGTTGRVVLEPVALGGRGSRAIADGSRSDDRGEDADWPAGDGRRHILDAIDQLHPEGSTNTEDGLRLGYEMARRGYRPGAINRIVLCSDGVANEGSTSAESILANVRSQADKGIQLSTIGFGMGNYNDVLMEQLADRGDGNHYYVDDIDEARRVFVENLTGTLQVIAQDAKVQVEFDSTRVLRYRLLGFENRDVADRDFRNDKVDAGEIGAGHEVTALYEVKLAPQAAAGTLATVRLRYARPEHEAAGAPQVREISQRFESTTLFRRFEDAPPRFRLDAAVAEFAEILRGSYWAKEGRLSDVLSVARNAAGSLRDNTATEFVLLVEKAAVLKARSISGEHKAGP